MTGKNILENDWQKLKIRLSHTQVNYFVKVVIGFVYRLNKIQNNFDWQKFNPLDSLFSFT